MQKNSSLILYQSFGVKFGYDLSNQAANQAHQVKQQLR